MNHKLLKTIAIVALFFFSWTFAGVFQVAYAIDNLPQTSNNTHSSRTPKSEERFQKAIEEIGEILEDTVTDRETKASKAKAKKGEIEELDNEIKKQFAETEKKLRDAGLPHEILQRHHKFVKHYEDNLNELKANLDSIEKTKGLAVEVEIEKAKKHLQRVKPPKKHIPLDPNKLPHRTPKVEKREPRLKKEDFERDFIKPQKAENQRKPILVASIGSLKGLLSPDPESQSSVLIAQASNQPTPADLAETIEVQFTPEIIAKAQELGNNPVKIYNWVRNNIEFVPTYGSIQGAHMTLLSKQGNAFDTASLLIALLRASNIPTRYVYGTIELPIDKVMNWAGGFTDANAALDFIASGGIPVTGIVSGGKVTKARMEHVWVEAYVPYGNYRGTMIDQTIKTWIPMDGSFKQYTYKDPIDFPSAVGFDLQAFINEVQLASTIDPSNSSISNVPQDLILQRIQSYVQTVHQYYDTNLQGKTVEDVLGSKKVISQNYPYLLGSFPYKTIIIGNKYSSLPDSLRWRINFKVASDAFSFEPDFSYTASTAFLASKSMTLSYKPSTTYDESLVQTYGYIEKVPPYLLNLTSELIISGEAVASGIPVGSGRDIEFIMTFISPNGSQDAVFNKETVGAYLGIGLDLSWFSKSLLDQRIAALNQAYNNPTPSPSRKLQEYLSFLVSFYFAELDANNNIVAKFGKVVNIRHPSAAIIGSDLKVDYLWGIPQGTSFVGLFIDVDRNIHSTAAKDGDKNKAVAFNISSGYNSSSMEHALWEQIFNLPGISAVKVHQLSNEMGIPIHEIDQSNISSILPILQISSEAKSDIADAVNAGKIVHVPQRNIQYFDWIGIAYIILDPETGAGGYIISGGLSGGSISLLLKCIISLIQLADLVPLPPIIGAPLSAVIEYLALTASLIDIWTSDAPLINKGIASVLAYLSFMYGMMGALLLATPFWQAWAVSVAISILEAALYVSISVMLGNGIPFIHSDPLKECKELLK